MQVEAAKFWVDVWRSQDKQSQGKLLISMQLVPECELEKLPAGAGREDPNANPKLPKPTGRLRWSFNPFFMCHHAPCPELSARLAPYLVRSAPAGATR